jgi:isopenicillin N synthase-like dioxygenase
LGTSRRIVPRDDPPSSEESSSDDDNPALPKITPMMTPMMTPRTQRTLRRYMRSIKKLKKHIARQNAEILTLRQAVLDERKARRAEQVREMLIQYSHPQ